MIMCPLLIIPQLGDGICDRKYVTKLCMWDNGDCCEDLFDSKSTIFDKELYLDEACDGGLYNTEECMWDNGSCVIENYPECHVNVSSKMIRIGMISFRFYHSHIPSLSIVRIRVNWEMGCVMSFRIHLQVRTFAICCIFFSSL